MKASLYERKRTLGGVLFLYAWLSRLLKSGILSRHQHRYVSYCFQSFVGNSICAHTQELVTSLPSPKELHTTFHALKEGAFLLRPQLPLIYHQIFTNMSTTSIILPVDFVAIAFAVWYDEVRQAG